VATTRWLPPWSVNCNSFFFYFGGTHFNFLFFKYTSQNFIIFIYGPHIQHYFSNVPPPNQFSNLTFFKTPNFIKQTPSFPVFVVALHMEVHDVIPCHMNAFFLVSNWKFIKRQLKYTGRIQEINLIRKRKHECSYHIFLCHADLSLHMCDFVSVDQYNYWYNLWHC